MENSNLLKLSLIISLIGTFSLLLILEYQTIPLYKIEQITKEHLETKVRIQGTIITIKETPGILILKVRDTKTITTIVFKEEKIPIEKDSVLEIEGKIQEYQDELELIADKITLIK